MYSAKVLDHFRNPRNKGKLKDADAVGKVGNPICGDVMYIYIKVRDNKIADIGWETMGCAAAIATSSMITELAKGKTLDKAMELSRDDVAESLEGLPPIKMHCSNLAADGLHKAIENYKKGKKEGETKEEVIEQFLKIPGVDKKTAEALWNAGFISMDELKRTSTFELTKLKDLDEKPLKKIKEYVDNLK